MEEIDLSKLQLYRWWSPKYRPLTMWSITSSFPMLTCNIVMKEVDREIDEILADSERKTVENQTAPFVP